MSAPARADVAESGAPDITGWLRYERVTKHYRRADATGGTVVAASDVTLDVPPGGTVGIIGPNGAGKSTLLKLAAGVTAPTSGRIRRRGRTLATIELGAGLHPDLTGRENIRMTAALAGLRERTLADRFDDIVGFSELGDVLDHPARTYSSGMVARLSLSVALHADPQILLIDEVLSVGDLEFQRRSRDRIGEMTDAGLTLVLVSHDLGLVAETCERGVLLVDGRVVEDGTAESVVRRYVGLPQANPADDRFRVEVDRGPVATGQPVELRLWAAPELGGTAVRIDVVVRRHPTFLTVGEEFSVVFATTVVDAPAQGSATFALGTEHLPPGRFDIQCTLEGPHGVIVSSSRPLVLTGPPGPFAVRLPSSTRITAIDTTATAGRP